MKEEFSGAASFLQAQAEFVALVDFIREDRQSEEISQVEKQLFRNSPSKDFWHLEGGRSVEKKRRLFFLFLFLSLSLACSLTYSAG